MHTFNIISMEAEASDLSEFEDSLGYRAGLRTSRTVRQRSRKTTTTTNSIMAGFKCISHLKYKYEMTKTALCRGRQWPILATETPYAQWCHLSGLLHIFHLARCGVWWLGSDLNHLLQFTNSLWELVLFSLMRNHIFFLCTERCMHRRIPRKLQSFWSFHCN